MEGVGSHRLIARGYARPMAEEKVKGPASYFPSIEKKYGQPISHWMSVLETLPDARHSEMVAFLKTEHAMGHGHAGALVAHHRAQRGL